MYYVQEDREGESNPSLTRHEGFAKQRSWTLLTLSHRNVFRNESWKDTPQVTGADHQGFSTRNKLRTRVVVLDMRNVEDPASREHSRGEDAQNPLEDDARRES